MHYTTGTTNYGPYIYHCIYICNRNYTLLLSYIYVNILSLALIILAMTSVCASGLCGKILVVGGCRAGFCEKLIEVSPMLEKANTSQP